MDANMINVILTILVFSHVTGWSDAERCYSASQGICTVALSKLWEAKQQRQYSSICKHVKALHTCTMNYATICQFSQYDKDLYQADIVQTFTKKPYNCAIIGGNMKFKGDQSRSNATRVGQNNIAACCLILVLMFTRFIDQTC